MFTRGDKRRVMRVLGTIVLILLFWIVVGGIIGLALEAWLGSARPALGVAILAATAVVIIYVRHIRKQPAK